MGASAATCGSHKQCPQQEKRHGSGDPVAVAGLGEYHCGRGGGLGLGRRGHCGLGYCRSCLGCRGRGFHRGICRGPCGGLSGSGVSIGGRLVRAIARRIDPLGLPRRGRGDIWLNHHARRHYPCSINHATSTKDPPAGVTNRADTSDPPRQATPPSAPAASSHEASTESRQPAAPSPRPASCRYTP